MPSRENLNSALIVTQAGGEAAAHGAVWAHLLPPSKCPPTLAPLEQLLSLDRSAGAGPLEQQVSLCPASCCRSFQFPAVRSTEGGLVVSMRPAALVRFESLMSAGCWACAQRQQIMEIPVVWHSAHAMLP